MRGNMTIMGYRSKQRIRSAQRGFTIQEVVVVVAIALIIAGIGIPNFMNMAHAARLKGAATDFSGLLQTARMRAEMDDRYYSVYVLGGNPQQGYVDIYPQNANGTSGNGGTAYVATDPVIQISTEITPKAATSAPNTANLKSQLLPSGSPVVPQDGTSAGFPFTFSPRGLPCLAAGGVCDSLGGPQARWTFFQNNVSLAWAAVTVTPAGRIQRWFYTGGATGTWNKF
jgi:prepilin-type N-terminal cleavage/methylation domain-containing protein